MGMSYPGITPCVTGLEHYVGPAVGGCSTLVYGWGFSTSTALKCAFGETQTAGTYISPTLISCETPGSMSPHFASVTASNDGVVFTNTTLIGRTTKHLLMDSVLYTSGD